MSYFNIENFVKFNNIANSVNHLKEALRKKLRYYDKYKFITPLHI